MEPTACLIVLDDELIGELTIAAARALVISGEIAPLKIFTVSFCTDDLSVLMNLRAKFFTFEQGCLDSIGLCETGRADELLKFIDEQALSRCETIPSLLGYSLSGSFALQAVARNIKKFGNVAAISPSLWAEPRAETAAETALEVNQEMFCHLAAGTGETDKDQTGQQLHMFQKIEALGSRLGSRFSGRVSTKLYDGETHFGTPFAAICDSLRAILGNR
ncbi:MAG: alpha/beta hydrolase-fold protein [Parasphingorhabdus sp.]